MPTLPISAPPSCPVKMINHRHAGIEYQEISARINVTRASFASLPGELRNMTYAATLRWPTPISVVYDPTIERFITPNVSRVEGRTPIEALGVLSSLDHNIRCEARSYFFANNVFVIETNQSLTTDPDYIETYINFLEDIGLVGRRSLRWLRLTVSGDCRHHRPTLSKAIRLWALIVDCRNLLTLDLYAEIDYFYIDQQALLKLFMSTEGCPISKPWSGILDSTQRLRSLTRLTFRPVFSGRWRYFDVAFDGKLSKHAHAFRDVRFRIHRPINEAADLSAQLKGHVRQGLRGSVRVLVVKTEVWQEYGRDILMVRKDRSEMWSLRDMGIIKPYGRAFNYSNGLKED
jgi:hypothetical protein